MISDRTEIARHLVRAWCQDRHLMAVALGEIDLVRKYLDANPEAVRTTATDRYFPMRDPRAGGHIYNWSLVATKRPSKSRGISGSRTCGSSSWSVVPMSSG